MNRKKLTLFSLFFALLLVYGCNDDKDKKTLKAQVSTEAVTEESKKANTFFERVFDESVDRNPTFQAYLGIKKDQDKWDDISPKKEKLELEIIKKELVKLKSEINYDLLDEQTKLSYQLLVESAEEQIANEQFRLHNYPVNQMFGAQSDVPSLLINMHPISDEVDAKAYISRLNGIKPLFNQLVTNLEERRKAGIMPPKFVFAHVIRDCKNLIKGNPFTKAKEESTLLEDFRTKIEKVEGLDNAKLLAEAETALKESVKPAYEQLITYLEKTEKSATTDDGVWKFPNGGEFYNAALKRVTSTDLTADQIHQIGLDEVSRIHGEMREIMKKVNFEGSLQDFFAFMRTDDQFYYPNTEEGKEAYMKEATALIDEMKGRLDELFITKPKADIIVKAVEPFRERSAGKAFYQSPSMDGKRPGTYYANMYDTKEMPTYQMKALAYHEGLPGHHMQLAIAQELKGIPKFRKFGRYTAYTEGWGLYSELVPKEMGLYQDPYSDFGRLAMELWRACRLVVDTGIHAKKWTREEGIAYYVENTPNPKGDAVKMVERHIVMPGQATAYKIGMLKILELREHAKTELQDKFDIREFHEVVLTKGPLPLSVLEKQVKEWI
ncbi:DUF885 domain-containing protein, partial [Xanthovirga aplysinae]|uniref:DUF885 domain-containing protein n=1 Tax=Xanthovirga aplysinae TaxID=2529853 RepID=UPI0012BD2D0C